MKQPHVRTDSGKLRTPSHHGNHLTFVTLQGGQEVPHVVIHLRVAHLTKSMCEPGRAVKLQSNLPVGRGRDRLTDRQTQTAGSGLLELVATS